MNLRSGTKKETMVENTSNNIDDDPKGLDKDKTHPMVYTIFIGLLLDLLGFTLILPLFPSLLDFYKNNDPPGGLYPFLDSKIIVIGNYLGAPEEFNSVLFGGFIGSLFSMLQFVASPIMGSMSDHYGRRPLLLISSAGIVLSYFVWALAGSFKLFVLARIIGGLSKGNVSLSTAIITDVSNRKTRGKGMALIGIAFSIGFIVGPIIGSVFSVWAKTQEGNWFFYPALCALTLGLANFGYIFIYFKETLGENKRQSSLKKSLNDAITYLNPVAIFRFESLQNLNAKDHKSLRAIGLVYFIYLFIFSGLEFTLTFLTHIRFNFTSMQQGKMFLFIGSLMAVLQGGYVRRIPQGKEKSMVLRGLIIIVPSFAIIGLSQTTWVLYIGIALYAVSTAFVVPCMNTLVSQFGEDHQKGIVMGVYRSIGALGRAIGPIFASLLYWSVGPELCYCIGGLGLIIPYILLKKSI